MESPSDNATGPDPINPFSALVFRLLFDEEERATARLPAAQARIWAAIDGLRKMEGQSARIHLLERVSEGLHRARSGTDPRQLRGQFAQLAEEWLGCATLH